MKPARISTTNGLLIAFRPWGVQLGVAIKSLRVLIEGLIADIDLVLLACWFQ